MIPVCATGMSFSTRRPFSGALNGLIGTTPALLLS